MQSMERALASHESKLADLEHGSRISNLVVFEITESPSETEAVLRSKVIFDVFEKKLGVSTARIHTLDKKARKRPVYFIFKTLMKNKQSCGILKSWKDAIFLYRMATRIPHQRKKSFCGRVQGEKRLLVKTFTWSMINSKSIAIHICGTMSSMSVSSFPHTMLRWLLGNDQVRIFLLIKNYDSWILTLGAL